MRDIFDLFDRVWGNLDAQFRDMEREWGVPNRLPIITLPSVKTKYTDKRTFHDGEKTINYVNGMIHKDNGPAVVYDDGKEEFWLKGMKVSKQEFESHKQQLEDDKIHYVHIDGVEYTLTGKQLKELNLKEKLKQLTGK
jgi:hypothetical protein